MSVCGLSAITCQLIVKRCKNEGAQLLQNMGVPGELEDAIERWRGCRLDKSVAASAGAEVAGFAKVRERIKQEPDFDRSKVDSIKKAIQDGQYPLNPRRIAESFVAMEQMISG